VFAPEPLEELLLSVATGDAAGAAEVAGVAEVTGAAGASVVTGVGVGAT